MIPSDNITGALRMGEVNISQEIFDIVHEISLRVPAFNHVRPECLQVCVSSNRAGGKGATFGKLVPLRFRDGEEILNYRGRYYVMPHIVHNGTRLLYLIYFYSPRFFDLSAIEKLRVIFHELYHIHPDFNGDIRRFGRGRSAHGNSKKNYDRRFESDLHSFKDHLMDTPHWKFLTHDSRYLFSKYGRVLSHRMKIPKPEIIA